MSKVNQKAKSQSLNDFRSQKDWHKNLPAMYLISTDTLFSMLDAAPNKQTKRIILNELNHRGFIFSNGMLMRKAERRMKINVPCIEAFGKSVYK